MDVNEEQNYVLVRDNEDDSCTFKARFLGEEVTFVVPIAFREMVNQIMDAGRDAPVQDVSDAIFKTAVRIPNEMES